jgi:hypothetical protein
MAVTKYLVAKTKFDKVEVVEFLTLPVLASDPPKEAGRMFFKTSDNKIRSCEDGSNWSVVSAS